MTKILGIETSCDETAVAVVTSDKALLANVVLSQQDHAAFGGVVPEVAARAHLDHIDALIERALEQSDLSLEDIDAIAVTAGPGLIGGVMVGAMTAKALATVTNKPLIAVNHLEGHALTARLTEDIPFPYLLLLVSGGHCQLLVVRGVGKYEQLGTTLDDALGEAFDKTAKLLGLGYPGGPAVEKLALESKHPERFPLPTPMVSKPNCDFSFSGLKTAVRRIIDEQPEKIPRDVAADICASFQNAVSIILKDRVGRALEASGADILVVAGGVAANKYLHKALTEVASKNGARFYAPPLNLCTDNAAMIAWAGMERFKLGLTDDVSFPVYPRWPLDTLKG